MKTLHTALFVLVAGSLFSAGAQAGVYDPAVNDAPYIGAKAGSFLVHSDDFDNPIAYGFYGGYNFDPNFSVELEYVTSSDADVNVKNGSGDMNMSTYGAYGTYRYYFPSSSLYAKGKLGFNTTKAEISLRGTTPDGEVNSIFGDGDESGVAGGLGLGFAVNDYVSIEGEYAYVDADIELLSIGAHLRY